MTAERFVTDKAFAELLAGINNRTTLLLGHTRWRTRGDERGNSNNHPIRAGEVIGTHNGTIQVTRAQADWRAVQRGTVQHEILEGECAAAFIDGANLEIQVSCRSDAGVLEDVVPYALAATLEVAENMGIDIYSEVAVRVNAARVRVAFGEQGT